MKRNTCGSPPLTRHSVATTHIPPLTRHPTLPQQLPPRSPLPPPLPSPQQNTPAVTSTIAACTVASATATRVQSACRILAFAHGGWEERGNKMILVCTRQFVKYPDSRVTRYLYTLALADGRDVNRVMAEFVLAHPIVRTKKLSVQTEELWQRELWR